MELQQELKNKAVSLGLCQQWQDEWGTPDTDALIKKYIKGIDFAIKHDFPSVKYINKSFSKDDLHKHGVYCDDKFKINGTERVLVILGDSNGTIDIGGYGVCTIYVRHNSNVKITVNGFASVIIKVYDNAKADVSAKGYYRPRVYQYSDDVSVLTAGEVTTKYRSFEEVYGD